MKKEILSNLKFSFIKKIKLNSSKLIIKFYYVKIGYKSKIDYQILQFRNKNILLNQSNINL